MNFFIHYRPDDGEILGYGNSYDPQPIEGMAIAFFAEAVQPDSTTQKIDPATGELIDKTPAEARAALMPTLRDVQVAAFRELRRTDLFMLSDYPVDEAAREAWKNYRKSLRDMSKHSRDAADMIKTCDTAPDGTDPFSELRARL
jgi:hypothetical protein